jgi:ABC-type transport system involved in cytochrome bd biosynthesis fused ATPase/permease subunit
MKAKSKKKRDWGFPNIVEVFLVLMLGVFMSKFTWNTVALLYLSAIFTLVGLPILIILNEDREKMRATQELIRILEGGE